MVFHGSDMSICELPALFDLVLRQSRQADLTAARASKSSSLVRQPTAPRSPQLPRRSKQATSSGSHLFIPSRTRRTLRSDRACIRIYRHTIAVMESGDSAARGRSSRMEWAVRSSEWVEEAGLGY